MSNSFYNKTNAPSPNSPGSSAQIRNEFDLVYQAFNKMPVLSLANANKLVAINSTGNGLTQVNSLTGIGGIDNTPIGATTPSTGSFTNLLASGVVNLGLAVAIGGGTINNSIIGGVTPNAAYFTTAAASSGFTGNLTGNVTGNLTGNVAGNVTGNIASSGTSTFNNLTITGTLDMSSGTAGTITGLSAPTNASDAATKQYVDTADALKLNLAGGSMSGEIAMGGNRITGMANPSSAQDAATKTYVDTADALKLNLSGGALTGALAMSGNKITGLGTPTASTDAANKAYVDNAIQGLDAKASVRVASTANLNLTGTQTVDGVALVVGDRVLVKNQDTPASNGLYTVSSGTWARTTDGDTWDELVAAYVFVEDGTTNGRNGFLCTITQGGTIGVTSISWVQFNSAGQIDAGNGLTKTGNRLDVATASADRIVVNPDNIDLAVTGISAGTYKSVTVDIYGRVVSGGNPNSLSGYGITDAYSKTEADLLYDAKLSRSGGTMTGAIAMGNNKITGLGTPTANGDAATKLYADGKLALTGGTMSGAIAMGSNKITGLADPTVAQDAVTLNYVTTLYGSTASAAASAANAATSEANALNYKNAAGVSASNAADSAAAAAASYDSFDDRYLGSKTSDPTTDNDGNALIDGALYWNSTLGLMKAYKLATTSWILAYVPSDFYTAAPASSTANGIALFDGTTGKLLKDSASTDGLIHGLTVGKGGGSVATNTALGVSALAANTIGDSNTAVGRLSATSTTTGGNNAALGEATLFVNTTGSYNTAIGGRALFSNTTASNNTAVGYQAGYSNTTGTGQAFFGYRAGYATTADYNTFAGWYSGYANTTGQNTGFGANTLNANTTGTANTALGGTTTSIAGALQGNTTGSYNTAVGVGSLSANTTASNNTAVGYQAGYGNTTGSITAIGFYALKSNTTGVENTALGQSSLLANTTGGYNTGLGRETLYSNTTGAQNTAAGWQAMILNTTGSFNAAFGLSALQANTTGGNNTALGYAALYNNTTAYQNTAVGYRAGFSGTTANQNTIIGTEAGFNATTSAESTFVGYLAGYGVTTGNYNTFLGAHAGQSGTVTGNLNTCVGIWAGAGLTSGSGNTFVGAYGSNGSGSAVTTGSKNTILGAYTGNQGGLNITTASNNVVLSDGDGTPYYYGRDNATHYFGIPATSSTLLQSVPYQTAIFATNPYIGIWGSLQSRGNLTWLAHNIWVDTDTKYKAINPGNAAMYAQFTGDYFSVASSSPASSAGQDVSADMASLIGVGRGTTVALQGAVNASGTGITFPATQNASSDANTLDDYEEGTWTPTVAASTTNPTNPVVGTGKYTKVGNVVTVQVDISNGNTTGASGAARITGLPFVTKSSTEGQTCAIWSLSFLANDANGYASSNESQIRFIGFNNGSETSISAGTGAYCRLAFTYLTN